MQVRRTTFTIKPGINADGSCDGDLSIFVPPCPTSQSYRSLNSTGAAVNAVAYGGVMVCDYADSIVNYNPMAFLTPPTDGSWRVVGFGYELTNTTPVMYQSGTLLSYQSPYIGGTVSSVPLAEVSVASPESDVRYVVPISGRELPAPFTFSEASSLPTAK